MTTLNLIGFGSAILFLTACIYALFSCIYKFRKSVILTSQSDPKNQSASYQSFGYMGAFGGDAGAACADGGGGGSCS